MGQRIKIIKSHSQDEFERGVNSFIEEQEANVNECKVQYMPLMQPNGKPLYKAMIVVLS